MCDIWRGYITQRLLWDTQYHMCFTAPTAIQERNKHDIMKDFQEELDLYLKVPALIDFLIKWRLPHSTTEENLIYLYDSLIQKNFIGQQEKELIRAWVHDLQKITL